MSASSVVRLRAERRAKGLLRRRGVMILVSGALAGLPVTIASAQVYRWEDADGGRHYSDAPPVNPESVSNFKQLADKPVRVAMPRKQPKPKSEPVAAAEPALADKIKDLERELAAERAARQTVDAQAQASIAAFQQQMAEPVQAIPYVSGIVFSQPAPDARGPHMRRHEGCGRLPLPPCGSRLDSAPEVPAFNLPRHRTH